MHFEFLVDEFGGDASRYANRGGGEVCAAIRELVIEVVVLVLRESVHSGFEIASPESGVEGGLHPQRNWQSD